MKIPCYIKAVLIVFLISACSFVAHAQKLPNKQEVSVHVPANIKIDGKATEWNNQFQAYNKVTNIFYTLSNDDKNLYLVVQATDRVIIEKIVKGGIMLTINSSGKKNDKSGVSVTFPTYDRKNPPLFLIWANKPVPAKDTMRNRMQADSFMNACNKQMNDKFKIIDVTGVKSIADSIISVYNDEGFKAAALLDNKLNYTCELAIPLKQLGPAIKNNGMFNYNIKLNGAMGNGLNSQIINTGRDDIISFRGADGVEYMLPSTPQGMAMVYPTDFWGEYILAKK